MKNLKKFMWLFFIVFGLVFVCCGVWLTKTAITFKNEGVLTQATIIRIDVDYGADDEIDATVYVEYTVDGTNYVQRLGFYSSALSVGDVIPIYYMPNKPTSITYGKAMFLAPILFGGIGTLILALGVFIPLSKVLGNGKLKRLKEYGQETVAIIKSFNKNENVNVLEKNPAVIICEDAFGNSYKWKFLCERGQVVRVGDTISIYTDYNNKKYVVDIEEYFKKEDESSSKAYISDN